MFLCVCVYVCVLEEIVALELSYLVNCFVDVKQGP